VSINIYIYVYVYARFESVSVQFVNFLVKLLFFICMFYDFFFFFFFQMTDLMWICALTTCFLFWLCYSIETHYDVVLPRLFMLQKNEIGAYLSLKMGWWCTRDDPSDDEEKGFCHFELGLFLFVFFNYDDSAFDDLTLILNIDIDANVSNETHMTYGKPLTLTIKWQKNLFKL
jgi:hypothetical protein